MTAYAIYVVTDGTYVSSLWDYISHNVLFDKKKEAAIPIASKEIAQYLISQFEELSGEIFKIETIDIPEELYNKIKYVRYGFEYYKNRKIVQKSDY